MTAPPAPAPRSGGKVVLRLLGGLFAGAGLYAWAHVAWHAIADMEMITAEGGENGWLVSWGLMGTLLMIVGVVLLHTAADDEPGGAPPG